MEGPNITYIFVVWADQKLLQARFLRCFVAPAHHFLALSVALSLITSCISVSIEEAPQGELTTPIGSRVGGGELLADETELVF
jgi:hypothetical protein